MSMGNWCGAVRHIEQVLTITRQDGPDASFEVADGKWERFVTKYVICQCVCVCVCVGGG